MSAQLILPHEKVIAIARLRRYEGIGWFDAHLPDNWRYRAFSLHEPELMPVFNMSLPGEDLFTVVTKGSTSRVRGVSYSNVIDMDRKPYCDLNEFRCREEVCAAFNLSPAWLVQHGFASGQEFNLPDVVDASLLQIIWEEHLRPWAEDAKHNEPLRFN